MKNSSMLQRAAAIRAALEGCEDDETIAARLCTTVQAVRVIRKGLGMTQVRSAAIRPWMIGRPNIGSRPSITASRCMPMMSACPWRGGFASTDGANVAGWGQRRGEPRLAQTLALCRWHSNNDVRFICLFDANFPWSLRRFNASHADILEQVLQHEPDLFKLAPAGVKADGKPRKADPYVLQNAAAVPNGLIVSNDLYRAEIEANPQKFGWLLHHPERRITGMIDANGDILLGDDGQIRIPVVNDPGYYIR